MDRSPTSPPLPVVLVNDDGCDVDDLAFCGAVLVTVAAAESWDAFTELATARDWVGVEALAGLPGSVGDVVRANPVRFGQQPADTVASIRSWDRRLDAQRTFAGADAGFAAGSSRFTARLDDGTDRYELLDVAFLCRQGDLTGPVRDPELLAALRIGSGDRVPLARVREVARLAHRGRTTSR